MFEAFRTKYGQRIDATSANRGAWFNPRFADADGYDEFVSAFAGASFAGGLYRVHDALSGPQGMKLIAEVFPEFAPRVCPFGYDWLGRQVAVDAGRVDAGQPQVLLLEPGTGEALEVPCSFSAFHDEELIDFADAALAVQFFEAWSVADGQRALLRRDQCVGYRVPLFLGGADEVRNLELSDMDAYWSLCGQLRREVRGLPPGSSIDQA